MLVYNHKKSILVEALPGFSEPLPGLVFTRLPYFRRRTGPAFFRPGGEFSGTRPFDGRMVPGEEPFSRPWRTGYVPGLPLPTRRGNGLMSPPKCRHPCGGNTNFRWGQRWPRPLTWTHRPGRTPMPCAGPRARCLDVRRPQTADDRPQTTGGEQAQKGGGVPSPVLEEGIVLRVRTTALKCDHGLQSRQARRRTEAKNRRDYAAGSGLRAVSPSASPPIVTASPSICAARVRSSSSRR